jgi:MFS superfamily sulfate permease-like transporter
MLLLRVDAPLYFANVNPVKDALYKYERRAKEIAAASGRSLHFIIIDLSPVNDIDASAVHFFKVRLGASLVIKNGYVLHVCASVKMPSIHGRSSLWPAAILSSTCEELAPPEMQLSLLC